MRHGFIGMLTALATLAQRGSYRGTAYETAARYTDVYVRRNGTWRAVSTQSTRMPPPAPGSAPPSERK